MNEKARGLELIQEIERQELLGVPKGKIIIVVGPGAQCGKTALLNAIMNHDNKPFVMGHHRKKAIDILGNEGHLISFDEIAAAGWLKGFDKKLTDHFSVPTKQETPKTSNEIFGILSDAIIRGRRAGEQLRKTMEKLQTGQELKPLNVPEAKCGKFHNNLRSQLTTGGIKWIK